MNEFAENEQADDLFELEKPRRAGKGQTTDQNALQRINLWLDRLEDQARRLLEAFQPDELGPAQAATMAGRYITIIARLLELRQQFTTEVSSDEERLLSIIFGRDGLKDEP